MGGIEIIQEQAGYFLNYSTRFLLSIVVAFFKIYFQIKRILLLSLNFCEEGSRVAI